MQGNGPRRRFVGDFLPSGAVRPPGPSADPLESDSNTDPGLIRDEEHLGGTHKVTGSDLLSTETGDHRRSQGSVKYTVNPSGSTGAGSIRSTVAVNRVRRAGLEPLRCPAIQPDPPQLFSRRAAPLSPGDDDDGDEAFLLAPTRRRRRMTVTVRKSLVPLEFSFLLAGCV